jgi:RNA polymerase sigma-70 factor (ECF subfamily)
MRCFEKLDTFQGPNFAGWLKVIAVNACLNMIERDKRWAPLEGEPEPVAAGGIEDGFVQAERLERARRAIERLPQNQKLVFCMRYMDGYSYHEIESLTGFTSKQVKSFIQNARRNFELWWRA